MSEKEHKIFVEPIFSVPLCKVVFDGLSDEMNLEAFAREEIANRIPSKDKQEHWLEQSSHALHLKKEVGPLCDRIVDVVKQISNEVLLFNSEYKVEITAMWANRQKPHTQLGRHSHHNNMFAGVFYITESENFPPIIFWNPVDPQLSPTIMGEFNQFNSGSNAQSVKKDTLLIFPAYLDHSVEPNLSDEDRISIAFNVILRGEYDVKESLQSVLL